MKINMTFTIYLSVLIIAWVNLVIGAPLEDSNNDVLVKPEVRDAQFVYQ